MKTAVLPESFLRCLSPSDRKSLGKAGLTADECARKAEIKNERQLQSLIVGLLRFRGIEPIWHATHRKSTATVGTPDILFAVRTHWVGKDGFWCRLNEACAWECKIGNEEPSKEQKSMHAAMQRSPNCWRVVVIRSVGQALDELKRMGL